MVMIRETISQVTIPEASDNLNIITVFMCIQMYLCVFICNYMYSHVFI